VRYIYVKNGDVLRQFQRVIKFSHRPDGGPDAYLFDFLDFTKNDDVLLLSLSDRYAEFHYKNVTAKTFKGSIGKLGILGKFICYFYLCFSGILTALMFKPTRIVCGTTSVLLWISSIISRFYGTKLILSRHNQIEYEHMSFRKRIKTKIDKLVMSRANAVICHGPHIRNQLIELGMAPKKVFEFNVGYRMLIQSAKTAITLPGINGQKKNILFIGRVEKEKGVFDLLQATKEILAKNPEISLCYVGEGSALKKLRETVKELNLQEKVILTGYLPHDLIGPVIKNSYIAVTPTRSIFPEGRCKSALEPLVLGVPVIAPNYGPFNFVENRINGLLYKADSVNDLKEKIETLISDKHLYSKLSQGAFKTTKNIIDPEMTFQQALSKAMLLR